MRAYILTMKIWQALLLAIVFSLFLSCKKDNSEDDNRIKGHSKVKLINASQSSSMVDFYLDDAKITSTALAYGQSSEYISISSGTKNSKVGADLSALLAASAFNFLPSISYTSFFVKDAEGKGDIVTFEDNLGAVESTKTRIRFVNLSPNFTNTLRVNLPGGEFIVNTLPFKEASGYFIVEAGTWVRVSVLGSSAFKIANASEFEGGKNYTLWISGTSNANLTINKITYN